MGYHPSAIVGVSMGSVVGVTYALRDDWYPALLTMDTSRFPGALKRDPGKDRGLLSRIGRLATHLRVAYEFTAGWGIGAGSTSYGKRVLADLTQGRDLQDTRIPVVVCATELASGSRVVLRSGPASEAVYASSALAGVLPPAISAERQLVDGVYADIAPIDVARSFDTDLVLAVDPAQELAPKHVDNGLQAMLRAVEICQIRHAELRFAESDFVLRPRFERTIDTLDFGARRDCIAAGIQVVRRTADELSDLLDVQ